MSLGEGKNHENHDTNKQNGKLLAPLLIDQHRFPEYILNVTGKRYTVKHHSLPTFSSALARKHVLLETPASLIPALPDLCVGQR